VAIRAKRHRVDRIDLRRQRLPRDWTHSAHFTGRTLLDPELDQAEFFGFKPFAATLLSDGGIPNPRPVRGCPQQQTLLWLFRNDPRTGIAAFQMDCGVSRMSVPSPSSDCDKRGILFQNWKNFFFEINRARRA